MASNILLCDICNLRSLSNPSVHWCQDCDEALCSNCEEYHALSKSSKGHSIIPINDYQNLPSFVANIKHFCEKHSEKYQNYCQNHKCPMCYKCIQEHAECGKSIFTLEDVVKQQNASQSFHTLTKNVEDLEVKIGRMENDRKNNLTEVINRCKAGRKKIHDFRLKVNNHLDTIEQGLTIELQDGESKCSQKIKEILNRLSELEQEVSNCKSTLQSMKMHASDLQVFFAMPQIKKQLSEKENDLNCLHSDDFLVTLGIDTQIEAILVDVKRFGAFSIKTISCSKEFTETESSSDFVDEHMPKQIDEQKNENISQLKGVTSGNKCKGNSKILKDKEQHEKWLEMDKLRWKNVCVAEEPRILCVIRDMIDPNTAGSKKTVNLPASTSIGDVIDEISKLTRYIASSINIKYNKQVAAELEKISLYACANQKLSDICMLGTRRHEFTVVEKEDTIPQKLSEITPAPDPPNYDGIAYTSSSYISGSTPAKETVSKYPDSTA